MGQARLGQQIRQGLRMCLAIDRTDAGLAGPRGRWGLLARLGQGLGARTREARPPTPACSAQPTLRAGVPDTGLAVPAGSAEAWPQSELWSLLPQRASLSTLAWRGPQDARHAVPAGQGTLTPGEVGTGLWARARCRAILRAWERTEMEKGQVSPKRPRREGTEGGDVYTHETGLQGGEVLPDPRLCATQARMGRSREQGPQGRPEIAVSR